MGETIIFAHKHHPVEPLGPAYLSSSIARDGHKAELILTSKDKKEAVRQLSERIERTGARVVGYSTIFGSHGYNIELNREIKKIHPNVIGFIGGPAPTFTPELLRRGYDVACRYEGEEPLREFLNALEKGDDVGNIPNLWVNENPDLYETEKRVTKQNLDIRSRSYRDESGYDPERKRFVNATRHLLEEDDLNNIPNPDREFLYVHDIYGKSEIKHFMITRGCAKRCAYCHVEIMNIENKGKGKRVRRRNYESAAQEILEVKKKYGMGLGYDQSDIAGESYKLEFARENADIFGPLDTPRHIHVRFDHLARDGIARELARSGVNGVHAAIEAGDDYVRNTIHRRDMSLDEIIRGAENLRNAGIKMMTQNILGAPGETWEQMLKTLELNILVKPTFASASIFQPYPGTTALEKARDTGEMPVLDEDALIDMYERDTFYNGTILIKQPGEKRKLELFQKFFAIAVSNPQIYTSGVLEKIISSYPDTENDGKELEEMYRAHRAEADRELYGVEMNEIVMEEN